MNFPLHIRPGLSKCRSRRLRKKLRIAEFQELGFEYSIVWAQPPTTQQQDSFLDRFIVEVIEARGLQLGGGCNEGFIAGKKQNPSVADQEAVRNWLCVWQGVAEVQIGPLVDAWYDNE